MYHIVYCIGNNVILFTTVFHICAQVLVAGQSVVESKSFEKLKLITFILFYYVPLQYLVCNPMDKFKNSLRPAVFQSCEWLARIDAVYSKS